MFEDKIIFGFMIGFGAGLVKDLLDLILYRFNLNDQLICQYSMGMLFRFQGADLYCLYSVIAGYIADFFLSGLFGIFFIYLIKATGIRFIITKGLIFGIGIWFFIYGGLLALPISTVYEKHPAHTLIILFIHLIFGVILGFLLKRYGHSSLSK